MAINSAAFSGQPYANQQFLYLEFWQVSQSIANNQTTFGYQAYIKSGYLGSGSTYGGSYTLSGSATGSTSGQYWAWNDTTAKVIASGTFTKNHNADGTLANQTLTIVAGITIPGYASATAAVTLSVATIPRATTPTASTGTLGSSHTIALPRASSSFTHDVTYTFGSASGTIATGAGTSASWTPPLSLASQTPNATSGNMAITVVTKNGSTVIGTKSINVTMTVPTSVVPTVSSAAFSEAVAGLASQFQGFVRYKSKIKATISAAGAGGSTIKSITFAVDNQSVTVNNSASISATTPNFIQSPAKTYPEGIHVTVVDSRNRSTLVKYPYTVLDWYSPKITRLDAIRTNSSGVATDDGWNARIYYSFNIASVNNKNTKSWKIERWTGSAWTLVSSGSASYTATNQNVLSGAVFNPDITHRIRLTVTDYFGSSTATFSLPTSSNVLDFKANKKGFAVGKASELDALEVAWNAHFTGAQLTHNGSQVLTEANNSLLPALTSGSIANYLRVNLTGKRTTALLFCGSGVSDMPSGKTVGYVVAYRDLMNTGAFVAIFYSTSGSPAPVYGLGNANIFNWY